MMLKRTAKSCRSGTPMLVLSLREEAQATVSNKPGHRGEREVSRKTIARGMPGETGVTVVTTLVCLFFYHTRGCGCIERPAFPAPSDLRGREIQANLARKPRRDREVVFAVIARSEATKQSTLPLRLHGLLRGACHRAALCPDPLARDDGPWCCSKKEAAHTHDCVSSLRTQGCTALHVR